MTEQITAGQFHAADGVEDWRCLYHLVSAHFRTDSLVQGIALVDEIGRLADGDEQTVLEAEVMAPEQVRHHYLSRQLVLGWVRNSPSKPSMGLDRLARRLHVVG